MSHHIIRVIKSRMMEWVGHVAYIREYRRRLKEIDHMKELGSSRIILK